MALDFAEAPVRPALPPPVLSPPIDVPEDAAFLQLGGAEAKKSEAEAEAPPQKKEEPSKSIQIELGDTILEGGALLEQKARQLGLMTLVRHEMV